MLAAQPPDDEPEAARPDGFSDWLEGVDSLLTEHERKAFLELARDYQRRLFINRFWQVRDPFPQTPENEFRDAWEQRLDLARERFGGLEGQRAQTMLLVGPPDRILLSGTKLRKALSEGEDVSSKFSRPEVLEILRAYYGSIKEEDKVEIKMSGHSAK